MNGKRINVLILISAVVSSLALSGCGKRDRSSSENVFCYNESNGISSLDPAFARDLEIMWATNQLFDGLVELDSNLKVQPCIARKWEISPDGKTYVFHLCDSVYFHPSPLFSDSTHRKVVANDFVYSFERIVDPEIASPGQWIFQWVDTSAAAFEAPDDSTFVVHLRQAFAPFLGMLAMQYCNVVPHEVVDYYGRDFRAHPVGTGPFRFAFWYENVALVFHRNDNYFQRDTSGQRFPYLDAIKIEFVRDMTVEFQGLLQGRYDFMSGLHASFKDELLDYRGELKQVYQPLLRFQKTPFIKTDYIGIRLNAIDESGIASPLASKQVRQALLHLIHREEMIEHLRNNSVFIANRGFVPPVLLPGVTKKYYDYDPVRAEALLAEAGYSNHDQLKGLTVYTTSDYSDLMEFIQHEWERAGIHANVEVMQGSTFRDATANHRLQMFRKSWLADYPDPENFLSLFRTANFCPAGPNYTHYSNARYDELYDELCRTTATDERLKIAENMDSILMEDLPVLPLYYDQVSHFIRREVTGLTTNPVNMIDLKTVKKSGNEGKYH